MREISWEEMYELAKKYYDEYGNLEIPYTYCVNYNGSSVCLGAWIKKQSESKRYNKLSDLQVSLLEKIGINWYKHKVKKTKEEKRIFSWEDMYKLAKKYYEKHGNLLIPANYIEEVDGIIIKLGAWIVAQRNAYKGNSCNVIDSEQIKLLEEIGMIWEVRKYNSENIDECWVKNYKLAKKYYDEYGNLEIPYTYCVNYNGSSVCLGAWVKKQSELKRYNKLSDLQVSLLEEIGINWYKHKVKKTKEEKRIFRWEDKYKLAKKYYEKYGDLLIPKDYQVKMNNKYIKLGQWIASQRMAYKGTSSSKINEVQISKLEKIGMVWDVKKYKEENIDEIWLMKYELAKKYYEKHDDLLIPSDYTKKINDEIIYLGDWIIRQRNKYVGDLKPGLTDKQIKLLEKIGMVWYVTDYNSENISEDWLENYFLAKKYYNEQGDLLVPHTYVINYRNKKINLGTWISTQRTKYNKKNISELDSVKIKLLDEIGMIWNVIQYKNIDKYLKKQYMLYEQNKLNEVEIVKLLEDGAFAYGDSDEILKTNTLEFYRKKIMNK